MAINFLDNVQFNQNQLLGARLQVETADANVSNPDSGQIIYNSTSNKFKYYNGTEWIDPTVGGYTKWIAAGGSSTVQDVNDGDTYKPEESTIGPGIFAEPVTKASTVITQPLRLFTKNMTTAAPSAYSTDVLLWGTNTSATTWKVQQTHVDDVPVSAFGAATSAISMGSNLINNVTDPSAAQDAATKAYVDANAGTTYTLPVSSGTNAADIKLTDNGGTVASTVNILGITNETTVSNLAPGNITIGLPDDVTIAGELTVSGAGQSSFGGQVTIPTTPSASTDAASKAYVDSSVAGGLNVKGGFNASTGAIVSGGNLTSGGSRVAIAIGDYYVVTVAGNFFGNAATPLTPGDSVLVQTAANAGASVEGDFAVIQSDTDVATISQIGLGNVNDDASVPNMRGLDVTYTNGTAKVGLDIKSGTALPQAVGGADKIIIWDGTSGNQGNYVVTTANLLTYIEDNSTKNFVGTTSLQTTHTFTHNLDTFNVLVQLYDTSTKETVYATVDRTSVDVVTATTAANASLTALIRKMD